MRGIAKGGRVQRALCAVCAGCAWLAAGAAAAEDYPTKPIRLVIGFPPGGSNDIVARHLTPELTRLLGKQVVVENRPGANATIATQHVATSEPDGYTLTLGSASPLVLSLFTYPNIPYDTVRDFAGITTVAMTAELIAIHPSLPPKSLQELIALAKQRPGKITFASSGNGGLPHLAIELFKSEAGIDLLHVPFKGAGPAATDAIGGHIDGIIMDFPVLFPHVKSGKLRPLAMLSEERNPLLPEIPTSAELGLPKVLAVNWFAVLAPAKTPQPILEKLHGALVKAVTAPQVKSQLQTIGVLPMTMDSPEAFTTFLKSEVRRWGKIARDSGAAVK